MWPRIPLTYQNLPQSDSGSFWCTRSHDYLFTYQAPTRHALLGPARHQKTTLILLQTNWRDVHTLFMVSMYRPFCGSLMAFLRRFICSRTRYRLFSRSRPTASTTGCSDECFFWYQFTLVVPDKIQTAVKRLCVHVHACVCKCISHACASENIAQSLTVIVVTSGWLPKWKFHIPHDANMGPTHIRDILCRQ